MRSACPTWWDAGLRLNWPGRGYFTCMGQRCQGAHRHCVVRGAWETIGNTEFDAVDYAEGLAGRTGRQGEMGGGWGEKVSESGFAGLLDAQDGETADYLTQRVGHYPDNRSILTFLILTTRVERVPRPGRIALRDTP